MCQKTNILQLKIWQKTTWAWHKYKEQLPIKRVKPTTQHAYHDLALHRNKRYLNVKYCYSAVHKTFAKITRKQHARKEALERNTYRIFP